MIKLLGNQGVFNRAEELNRFDSTKAGVKGLVDSGVTEVPPIFFYPPEALATLAPDPNTSRQASVPVIDLSGPHEAVVEALGRAARSPGIFQVMNHGIPEAAMDRTRAGVKAFHELPAKTRAEFYGKRGGSDGGTGTMAYRSNFDLYVAEVASWHDSLRITLAPSMAAPEVVPEVLRGPAEEWDREIKVLGERLVGLLGEGLGLDEGRLRGLTVGERRLLVGHYYPFCPQPDRTMGLAPHADPALLNVLLQGTVGGLQFKSAEGVWTNVDPIPGALTINVGDLFQILSNDAYKSVVHRVLANSKHEPRVSVVVFINPSNRSGQFGPLPELVLPHKPAVYRQMTYEEFIERFYATGLDGQSLKDYFKI